MTRKDERYIRYLMLNLCFFCILYGVGLTIKNIFILIILIVLIALIMWLLEVFISTREGIKDANANR